MNAMLLALLPIAGMLLTYGKTSVRRSLWVLITVAVLCFGESAVLLSHWQGQGQDSGHEVLRWGGGFFAIDPSSRLFLALISAVFTGVALYVQNRRLKRKLAILMSQTPAHVIPIQPHRTELKVEPSKHEPTSVDSAGV